MHKQYGFGTVGVIVLIVVVAVVGLAAWKIFAKDEPAPAQTNQTYTDTAGVYTLQYPSNWSVSHPQEGSEGPAKDWAKESRPVNFRSANLNNNNAVLVQTGCERFSIAAGKQQKDRFHTQTETTINGAAVLKDTVQFIGDAEQYREHRYFYEYNGKCLGITFRENHQHEMSGTSFDNAADMPGFGTITNSLKFN